MQSPPTLTYAEPQRFEPLPLVRKSPAFRAVILCWLIPFVLGATVCLLARINRPYEVAYKYAGKYGQAPPPNGFDSFRGALEVGGCVIIIGGCIATLVGHGYVIAFITERRRPAPNRLSGLVVPIVVMLFLLASNFAMALFCLEITG